MKVVLNENEELVKMIRKGLAEKDGYCPCRLEKIEENKCICKEFRDQLADENFYGYCHCRLYKKIKD